MASGVTQPPVRFDDIISVKPGTADLQFKVRVLKKWIVHDLYKSGNIVSIDMILGDKNGHKIQASIPGFLCAKFGDKIDEGKIYIMSNFTVKPSRGQSLPSFHKHCLIFNDDTDVKRSWGWGISTHGVSLIGSDNVLRLNQMFQFLVDVIGVVTYIRHDKDFFPDGTVANTITMKLTDNRNSYQCVLSGEFVDHFREMLKDNSLGLPVVVLQWVKVTKSQGRTIVRNVDGITKLYINPQFYEATKFRKGLVLALNRKRKTIGFCRVEKPIGFNFATHYRCKTIGQLRDDPTLGIYVINARIMDMTSLDTWWYPVCGCDLIIESYLGAFFCGKCYATDFEPLLKYRVKMVIEDDSGSTFIEAFDHVMLPIAVIDPSKSATSSHYFPRAFESVIGKSIMFIVEKKKHSSKYIDGMFELLCVSDDPEVIKFYVDKGVCVTHSKENAKIVDPQGNLMKPVVYDSPLTTTGKLLAEYMNNIAVPTPQYEVGESSNGGATKVGLAGRIREWEVGESSSAAPANSVDNINRRLVRPRLS